METSESSVLARSVSGCGYIDDSNRLIPPHSALWAEVQTTRTALQISDSAAGSEFQNRGGGCRFLYRITSQTFVNMRLGEELVKKLMFTRKAGRTEDTGRLP